MQKKHFSFFSSFFQQNNTSLKDGSKDTPQLLKNKVFLSILKTY